jgi:hypothetical protein
MRAGRSELGLRHLPLRRAGLFLLAAIFLSVGVDAASASMRATAVATRVAAATRVTLDPSTPGRGAGDAVATVRWLGPGLYQLDVQNTSGIGYIDTFSWVPPLGLTITAVTSSEGGKCALSSGDIECNGKMAPPRCTCQAGGELTVNFTAVGLEPTFANGYWTYHGFSGDYLQIEQMTPVPYHIPSALPKFGADLPLCKKGQKSTKARPCV